MELSRTTAKISVVTLAEYILYKLGEMCQNMATDVR